MDPFMGSTGRHRFLIPQKPTPSLVLPLFA
jgi:hypothetical protein